MENPGIWRRFVGRGLDALLPGHQYNARTGEISNVGRGFAAAGIQAGISTVLGPLGSLLAKPLINKFADRNYYGEVIPENIQLQNASDYAPTQASQISQPEVSYPSAVPQSVGNPWAAFMGGQGSLAGFGNTQFGNGSISQPGSYQPSSVWGQTIAAPTGSNLGFGNNVAEFAGGGDGTGSSTGSYTSSNRMPGIAGGRPANSSMLDIARRWAKS